MAIKKSFGGATILKPGAYSISKVDQSGGAPLGNNDTLFIVGESEAGAPGSSDGIQTFRASQVGALVEKYGSGPIVDCVMAALRPSKTPGVGGTGIFKIYKTNSSVAASAILANASAENVLSVSDLKYGLSGNDLRISVEDGTNPSLQKVITIHQTGERDEVLGQNSAVAQLSIQYTGDASTASMAISGASEDLKALVITLAGDQTDGSTDLSFNLKDFSVSQLVDAIDSEDGYSATLLNTQSGAVREAKELDLIDATDVKSAAVSLYRINYEMVELINLSSKVSASLEAAPAKAILANISKKKLAGGVKGASANSDFSNAFNAALNEDLNVILPAVSRDASEDIIDGLTDSASTYDISSVLASLDSALRVRGSVKNRKEAQGMAGFRKSTKADVIAEAQALSSELVQLHLQDVLVVDATGQLRWMFPHVAAALSAGIRLGTDVGEPLTHKFLNASGIGHVVDPETGLESGDFNPGLDFDEAIEAGLTFSEQAAGGFRIVVDNTTYGADQSFVWNRGSVIEASHFAAKSLRETAELVFVGRKVSNGAAQSIKSVLRSKLLELNAAEIITSSDDAPNGFREDSFVVTVEGNTANVQIHIKPVQGLDYVFVSFELGDIRQSS